MMIDTLVTICFVIPQNQNKRKLTKIIQSFKQNT